jgi:hypothetical protein
MVLGNVLNPAGNTRSRRYRKAGILTGYFKQSAIAFLAFVVAACLLNQIIPSPTIPANVVFTGPKYDYYKAHKDEYNTLFFGSSRIYSHVVPEVFDATVQSSLQSSSPASTIEKKGTAIKDIKAKEMRINSYNFGIPAMRALDSAILVEEVLADPPKNLKWVFFESILDKGYEPIPNARTQRAMYWHTWENTRTAAQYILTSDESLPSKAVLLSSHLLPFLYQQINVGRLFNQLLPSEFSAEEQQVAADFTATEGYYALTDEADPKRQLFLQNQADYLSQVAALEKAQVQPNQALTLSANKQQLLERVTRTIRAAGAEPIFVEPPSLHIATDFQAAQKLGIVDKLFSYKDPQRFPQLYSPSERHDADHLNDSGSREFTRLLAVDFAQAIAMPQPK